MSSSPACIDDPISLSIGRLVSFGVTVADPEGVCVGAKLNENNLMVLRICML